MTNFEPTSILASTSDMGLWPRAGYHFMGKHVRVSIDRVEGAAWTPRGPPPGAVTDFDSITYTVTTPDGSMLTTTLRDPEEWRRRVAALGKSEPSP